MNIKYITQLSLKDFKWLMKAHHISKSKVEVGCCFPTSDVGRRYRQRRVNVFNVLRRRETCQVLTRACHTVTVWNYRIGTYYHREKHNTIHNPLDGEGCLPLPPVDITMIRHVALRGCCHFDKLLSVSEWNLNDNPQSTSSWTQVT